MYVLLIFSVFLVCATICAGVILEYKKLSVGLKKGKRAIKCTIAAISSLLAGSIILLMPSVVYGADNTGSSSGLGFIAAALSTGLATIATGIAVGSVGSSALGAVSEEPKMLGRSLIYVGLAEGIAIYGLIISVMILGKI